MPEIVRIPLADLLVDPNNARLTDVQTSQPAAILAIATHQKGRLVKLARHIVERGLDPLSLPAVTPTSDQKKRYLVVEGNRRVVALKALETPALVTAALDSKQQKTLNGLSVKFASSPITHINCVLFESPTDLADLDEWVTLRHTGMNEGVGLVDWGADEKDRYAARHGQRSPAGQILDFVAHHGGTEGAELTSLKTGRGGIITSLGRLIGSPEVRESLGIDLYNGEVLALYPAREVIKGLLRVVRDLAKKRIKVGDIYSKKQRTKYADALPKKDRPTASKRLATPTPLGALGTSTAGGKRGTPKVRRHPRRRPPADRTALIPRTCYLNISPPRINVIYNELLTLSVDQFANASAVLLRVFVELSVDHHVHQHNLIHDAARRNTPLAKRLKVVAADLRKKDRIDSQLKDAIDAIADGNSVLAASAITWNQYVHNRFVFPKPSELRLAWGELQPFLEQVWP